MTTSSVTGPHSHRRHLGPKAAPGPGRRRARLAAGIIAVLAPLGPVVAPGGAVPAAAATPPASSGATVWLCRPGASGDPCALSSTSTQVLASGARSRHQYPPSAMASKFDCLYVYPT